MTHVLKFIRTLSEITVCRGELLEHQGRTALKVAFHERTDQRINHVNRLVLCFIDH